MPPVTQKEIEEKGMSLRDLSIANVNRRNTADVTADDLTNPREAPPVTPVTEPGIPDRVNNTVNNVLGSIRSQSETAKKLQEEQAAFQSFAEGQSGFDIQNEQLERFGVTPEKLQELEDIQLQLADRATESGVTKTRIQGAAGQTAAQAQREVTQEDREEAVRSAGLAARAAVLQGNIETGRQLATDAVNIALQDRTFQANAQLQAIQDLKDVVDEETAQLLTAEQRQYDAELAKIEELKTSISEAIVNGASQSEIAQLNSPNVSDEDKLALAQSITARGATEMRDLEIQSLKASNAASWALADERNLNALIARAEIGDPEAIAALGIATDTVSGNSLYQEMEASKGGKETTDSFNTSLEKAMIVADQLSTLGTTFQNDEQLRGLVDPETGEQIGVDLSPITSIFRSNNPYDEKAQQIQASINGIVPNLARGIYGEVGVLTDQDVERYARTIPNLSSTKEVRDAMLGLTLKTVLNSVRQKMAVQARAGRDVSGQTKTLEELEKTVGGALLPVNKQTPEYKALIEAGAPQSEVDSLLLQGYELDDVISYYTGQ